MLGTAGSPTANTLSVQGIGSGTPLTVTISSIVAITSSGTVSVVSTGSFTVTSTGQLSVGSTAILTVSATGARITDGTNTAAVKAALTAPSSTDAALVVALSPNGLNTNGQATMANSAPVVLASNQSNIPVICGGNNYETVAASQSSQVLGPTGATGDYITRLVAIPATTSPGNLLLSDGSTNVITVFSGGSSSVTNLAPFMIELGLLSVSSAWKVTTGSNISAIGIGKFT